MDSHRLSRLGQAMDAAVHTENKTRRLKTAGVCVESHVGQKC